MRHSQQGWGAQPGLGLGGEYDRGEPRATVGGLPLPGGGNRRFG